MCVARVQTSEGHGVGPSVGTGLKQTMFSGPGWMLALDPDRSVAFLPTPRAEMIWHQEWGMNGQGSHVVFY